MSDILSKYRKVEYELPKKQLSWLLYGVGLENLGKDGKPVETEVPQPKDDELLVRCDSNSLCFSDIKIIAQGGDHVRIKRDIAKEPVIMGHESVVTVIQVGKNLAGKYHIGERFVVQADVYVNGKSVAYGYALPGALTQFETIGQEILNGDDGCYLIPVRETTGYAEAAITEPWACVVHSFLLDYRHNVKADGKCLMVGGASAENITIGSAFANKPDSITAINLPQNILKELSAAGLAFEIAADVAEDAAFDDIIICGTITDDLLESLTSKLSKAGLFNVVGAKKPGRPLKIDVGRVHYEDWCYLGNPGNNIADSYAPHRKLTDLKVGGKAWFLGAGGPMGQMHIQRACEMPDGPSLIVATDIDPARLQELRDRFIPAAEAHNRKLIVLNPTEFTPEDFDAKLKELSGGNGFDDVIALVPVPFLIKQASQYAAEGGLLNIFAGVTRGTCVDLELSDTFNRGIRWVGSSGSFLSDMKETLRMAEDGELITANAVAAIGGLNAAYEGLELVKKQAIPGKIVIYQQMPELPLIRLSELKDVLPTVAAKLRNGKYWTVDAENELMRLKLKI
ncbi:MAG: alcohol dehydrogenase catalytic domain-containing protein [bacterium]